MKSTTTFVIAALLFAISCESEREKKRPSSSHRLVQARGYVVPQDSMGKPKVIPAMNPRVSQARELKKVIINKNERPVGKPVVIGVWEPLICTPGKDTFSVPVPVLMSGTIVTAGIPKVIIAKEPSVTDQNPLNIASFGKLQGLNDVIMALREDTNGNLWIGTGDNGIYKYDGKNFTHFTKSEGLPNNYIKSIYEDKNGNIWFSTFGNGFSKYNGKTFTNFSETEGLSNNSVWSMLVDKKGNVWIGTFAGGLDMYDGKAIRHYTSKEGFNSELVRSMLEDISGNIWFGRQGGVSKYDGNKFTHYTDKRGLVDAAIVCMLQDKSGFLWLGWEGGGLSKFDGESFSHFTTKEGLSDNFITSLFQEKNGDMWIGTRNGLNKYDGTTFTRYDYEQVSCILEDKRGILWFGTNGGGLAKYSGKRFIHFTENEGLSNKNVSNFFEDKSGNLWIGTKGGGVNKYDGESFSHLTTSEGMTHNVINCMLAARSGDLWFSHYAQVDKYDGKTFTIFEVGHNGPNSTPLCMLEDMKGNIWFATFMGGVSMYDGTNFTHYTTKEGLSHNIVVCMAEDSIGNLWFGTYGGGVSKYDGNSFTHFSEKDGLSDNDILSILTDSHGSIWMGSLNGGVNKYDGETFIHFTEKDGLISNYVKSIMEDAHGNLWFGTDLGLSKLSRDKLNIAVDDAKLASSIGRRGHHFKNYSYADGLSGFELNDGHSLFEASDGTIWIGATDRLTAFDPGGEASDTIPPNIQLTGVTVYNENIPWQSLTTVKPDSSDAGAKDTLLVLSNGVSLHDFDFDSVNSWYGLPIGLSLAYDNNNVTFEYLGITTRSPQSVKYQYMLEGLEQNWSAITTRSEANYGNLPHGKFIFKVKAMNGDGYWSNEYHYNFTIRPPWWHTWWAYALFVLSFSGIIYAMFRYRLNRVRLQHKTVQLEMQALRAQMNPHFIFNSLNSINLFILENDKLQASEYLAKFSRLVRLILHNSQEAFIPLARELEALELYLELESLRFNKRIKYKITVGDEIDTNRLKVPPLIIQPYAENAIWHGLMHKKEGGILEIELYQQEENLFCKVIDDGIGRAKAKEYKTKSTTENKSIGMKVTADRIAFLHDRNEKSSYLSVRDLILPDGKPGGTEVLMKMPVSYD